MKNYLVSFGDIVTLLKRHRRKILQVSLASAFLFMGYKITRPVVFEAKATFREKGLKEGENDKSLLKLLDGDSQETKSEQAISTMRSRELLGRVIDKLQWQATLVEPSEESGFVATLWHNLRVQLAHLFRSERLSVPCSNCPLRISRLNYVGEVKLPLTLYFTSDTAFILKNGYGVVGEGHLHDPYIHEEFAFTLRKEREEPLEGRTFHLTLLPRDGSALKLLEEVKIEEDGDDSTLLHVTFTHPSREQAKAFVDMLMAVYQETVKQQNDTFAALQLDYLRARQEEMFLSQTKSMQKHADILAKDLSTSGFVDFEKEMEFLFKNRLSSLEKTYFLDMQMHALQAYLETGAVREGQLLSEGSSDALKETFSTLSDLKVKRDSLVQTIGKESAVDESLLQSTQEVPGIDLDTASQLYLAYLKEESELEATRRVDEFILVELKNPLFEISSLTSTLQDPISQEIIKKSSALQLQLRDEKNHTPKEIERINTELEGQKAFLASHIEQTVKIIVLQEKLIHEKIRNCQQIMLTLTQERISILEKHVEDLVAAQLTTLQKQKELLSQFMQDTQKNMSLLPEKWISEQLMKQKVTLNKTIVEELTRLVESKNIAHNLNLVESAPVDHAYSPPIPKSPSLPLFGFLGLIVGAISSSTFLVGRALFRGVPATFENIQLENRPVAVLKTPLQEPLLDDQLETLRKLLVAGEQVKKRNSHGTFWVVASEHYPALAKKIAALLSKKQTRVLQLSLNFSEKEENGLLQYLEGKSNFPSILQGEEFDTILAGGISRFGAELVASSRFKVLIDDLKRHYDFIVCHVENRSTSAEAEGLLPLADLYLLTVQDETLLDLQPFLKQNHVIYLFEEKI